MLRANRYDYVLLDLELPVRRGRDASLEMGENLLREAVKDPALKNVGFIVISAHGHDTPDLAVELMKIGAADFVRKPYHGLEKKVREFLDRRGNATVPPPLTQSQTFTGGELEFHSDRVELNGIEICGDTAAGIIRHILEQLSRRDPNGEFVRLPAKILAEPFGEEKTQTVIDAINRFRERISEVMKAHGFLVEREDIIATRQGGAGYQLARNIIVRGHVSAVPLGVPLDREPSAEERQRWIVTQVASGHRLLRADLEKQFGISTATAKRDLAAVRSTVKFDAASGSYRKRPKRALPSRKASADL